MTLQKDVWKAGEKKADAGGWREGTSQEESEGTLPALQKREGLASGLVLCTCIV